MSKNKKIIIGVVLIVLLIAMIVAIFIVRRNMGVSNSEIQSYATYEEAYENADFSLSYSDRICGYPATEFKSNSSTIEVNYNDCAFTRKTYAVPDNSSTQEEFSESKDYDINGIKVTFKGENGLVYLATWNFNNYAYSISIDPSAGGVTPEEMTVYVKATM